jgi:hypothetical protein
MSYSLAAAAAASGLNKTTILRAIKKGRISGTRDELGQCTVEPVELHRIFPMASAQRCAPEALPQHASVLADAEQRAAIAEQRVLDLRDTIDDLRRDRDIWREQAQRLALPAQQPVRGADAGGPGGGRADHAALYDGSSPARSSDYSSARRRLCAIPGRHDRGAGARRYHVEHRDGESAEHSGSSPALGTRSRMAKHLEPVSVPSVAIGSRRLWRWAG